MHIISPIQSLHVYALCMYITHACTLAMQETGNIALAFPSNVFSLTSDDESSEQMNKSLAANANVTSQEEDDDSDGRQLLK